MNILERMMHSEKQFSNSEKKVYHFLTENLSKVETYTITKVANESHTSTSAVLRFCQTLGYKGYKDFRFDVISHLHNSPVLDNQDIVSKMTSNFSTIVNRLNTLERDKIQKLILSLKESSRIHLFGIHASSLPARQLYFGLQNLGIPSHLACDLNSGAHLTNIINEDDLLIMFSISGNLENFRSSLSEIENNMPNESYLVTLSPTAKSGKFFSNTILLPGALEDNQSIVDLQSIPMMFVEILLNILHSQL
ncbi:MurR/RpiR family transcriptional regulator [Streptococcus loxodontisalivarius]|uniref:DNA-binding MurR/RpiR family transcriptional regulator n=1 Tax=Streptococcus loxodontisalivarius TaxID=1349415 RepID=A0ABS2PS01_9STRE|nr:MurR/RpiR family transcriptional regulator [Streptococcus loxodontisalivarius]MBM7642330.1 DNA-binding MurR/RpiR family transcriptional regulator [Streptococcus loxodontisalivarius]